MFILHLLMHQTFDRVNHFQIYLTFMKRCIPVVFLNIIINWYSKLTIKVRWNTAFSDTLKIRSGVRQGGMLSPHLFNVYADLFINNIISKKNGCYLNRCSVACIMYADDLMLLSASVSGLQQLLDVYVLTAKDFSSVQ